MKPAFALSLSFEGISLLHRARDGWRAVGEVPLDAEDLPGALADLRDKASRLEPGAWHSKIIIPNDQIRYLSVETGPLQGDARKGRVEAELENATPYPLSDLVYDLSVEGNVTHVAAIARETLDEAEAFAIEHAFNPVSFVAIPIGPEFIGEPHFGQSAHAASLDGIDHVTPDGDPVAVIGPARIPEKAPVPRPEPEPPKAPDPEPLAEVDDPDPEPADPVPGFSSRRSKPGTGAPSLTGATRDVPPSPGHPTPPPNAPTDPPKPEISVAAPALDLPPVPDDTPAPASKGNFLSRRKAAKATPDPDEGATTQASPEPLPFKAANQDAADPETETERMTVFGARESQKTRGKPRYLGLMLTVALLFFLAIVAAWAAIFLEDGVTGLFRGTPEPTELATRLPDPTQPSNQDDAVPVAPQPAKSTAPVPATPPLASTPAPQAPETARTTSPEVDSATADQRPEQVSVPSLPTLSDTDTAVLDALRPDLAGQPADNETSQPLTQAEAATSEARYAATGIWPNAPVVPEAPYIIDLNDVYLASIDRTDLSQDAVALPPQSFLETDDPLNSVTSPAAAGTAAAVNPRGLVEPTPEGAMTPDGVIVYLGRPDVVPPQTPVRFETTPETSDVREDYLAALRPRLRPDELVELNERANLGGKSRDELAGLRPKLRPKTAKQIAEEDETPTAQAVVVSRTPKARPRNFAALVKKAKPSPTVATAPSTTTTAAAAASAASTANIDNSSTGSTRTGRTGGSNVSGGAVKPAAPSPASVARQATLKNSINLQRLNLIGVYGTPSNRRALIRLPSGRYKKVKVGDLVDGGRVIAIGESDLRYEKGSRSMTLKMPSG
ncbi:hypothetical protein [Falsiphaeobacter marinintestinus]|uniref:hypothetical protein n=1 Tax=Falsiphaeobacter marinintestinus TaxID=1492905 RepID=UPI0011B3CAD2|nr:hypothetical protein [Phaeobacter marinintestinus]